MTRPNIRLPAAIAAAFVLLASACGSPAPEGVSMAAQRVTATPIPTPTPVPTPRVLSTGDFPFENSGGRIAWLPTRNAGPWATNGSVELPTLRQQAPIVRVSVNARSEMVVPGNARDVAWLDQGPWPGQTQNPVLAGHIAYGRRVGTFNRLQDLSPGDPVHVTLDGARYTYRVIWVHAFDRNTHQTDQIMGYTEVPSVTLITCGGSFDRGARTHSKRVVARAQLVSDA